MDNWILLYCKSKQELRAQQHLTNQNIESYFPIITVNKLRAGKRVQAAEALFPRYLFVKNHNQLNLTAVRSTRGISNIVRFGDALAYVPGSLVQQIAGQQADLQQKVATQQVFQPGETLHILSGPFASLNAIFHMPDGESRSIVLLTFLGQQSRVPLCNKVLSKVQPAQLLLA